jgi:hypothetical protein
MKAKARPFWLDRVAVSCNYDAAPKIATIRGHTRIEGSKNSRPIYARLTLEELIGLEDQIHRTIAAIKAGDLRW